MRSRSQSPTNVWGHSLRASLVLSLCAFVVAGCSEDDDAEFVLSARVNATLLPADGTQSARVTVSYTTEAGAAPSAGAVVRLRANGAVINDALDEATRPLTGAGIATFDLRCASPGLLDPQVFVTFDGRTVETALPQPIQCYAIPEDGYTIDLVASPQVVTIGGRVNVTATVGAAEGIIVPPETTLTFDVTSGNGTFGGSARRVVRGINAGQEATAQVRVGAEAVDTVVCVNFQRENQRRQPSCIRITVVETLPSENTCFGSFNNASIPADGRSTAELSLIVLAGDGSAIRGAIVDLAVERGELFSPEDDEDLGQRALFPSNSRGQVVARIRSTTDGFGPANATATATWRQGGQEVSVPCAIEEDLIFFPKPTCQFQPMQPATLNTAGLGRDEVGRVTACFTNADGRPVEAGGRVQFQLVSTIGGASLTTNAAATNAQGCATVELLSGSQAGTVEVEARYLFGETSSVCTSGALPIRGARPSARGWNLDCTPRSVFVQRRSPVDQELFSEEAVTCRSVLRDRFGNPVSDPSVRVFFHAEQGIIVSPVSPDSSGVVTTTYIPNGQPPRDVAPFPGEPSYVANTAGGQVTRNPRDMVVTITAWTQGEEGFFDENGNGRWDEGEPFIDLGEPFFDYNDNNVFDADGPVYEAFIDVETPQRPYNGVYDGPNNRWDSDTIIWTDTRVELNTGNGAFGIASVGGIPALSDSIFLSVLSDAAGAAFDNTAPFPLRVNRATNATHQWLGWFLERPGHTVATTYLFDPPCPGVSVVNVGPSMLAGNTSSRFERVSAPFNASGAPAAPGERIHSYRLSWRYLGYVPYFDNLRITAGAGALPDTECTLVATMNVTAAGRSQQLRLPYNVLIRP